LSPQKLFNKKRGTFGQYQGDEESFLLILNDHTPIDIPYDIRSSLPIGYVRTGPDLHPQVNAVLSSEDQNMSDSQKLLLDWHTIFAHLNFARVQQVLRHIPFIANKFGDTTKCEPPMFHTCELAKAKIRANKKSLQTKTTERDGALKTGNVKVGSRVSLDHFESRLLGRTYECYGKPSSTKFKGGSLYVEHASGIVHCEHQVVFSTRETIRGKQSFEKMCMDNGVVVQDNLTDSGTFKAKKCVAHINETQKMMYFCGTNAQHQNGVAERAIQTISNMARAMILHAIMHWKDGIDASLWHMAVNHAIHIYNNNPDKGFTLADIFTGSTVPRHRILDLHV
jgi:hypothetical protein